MGFFREIIANSRRPVMRVVLVVSRRDRQNGSDEPSSDYQTAHRH